MSLTWDLALLAAASIPAAQQSGAPAPSAGQAQRSVELVAGEQLVEAGRFADAERQLELAAAKAPKDYSIWNLLGTARFAQKNWIEARDAFQRALALVPDAVPVLVNLGVCRFALSDLDGATQVLARAVALEPGASRAHTFLARIASERGDSATAEREFELAVNAAEPDPLAPLHYGVFLFQGRRLDEAAAQFERCLVLVPDLPSAHLNLGLIRQRQGDTARGKFHLDRFHELSQVLVADERKGQIVTHLLRNSSREIEAGRLDSALSLALEAAEAAPELPVVHQFLARIWTLKGRPTEAAREQALVRELSAQPAAK